MAEKSLFSKEWESLIYNECEKRGYFGVNGNLHLQDFALDSKHSHKNIDSKNTESRKLQNLDSKGRENLKEDSIESNLKDSKDSLKNIESKNTDFKQNTESKTQNSKKSNNAESKSQDFKDLHKNTESKSQDSKHSHKTKKNKKTFCIMMPPPNVTGVLHIGHALTFTLQDIIVRYKRMQGYKTLWQPGLDHAGIATQNVVEKQLLSQGITKEELGREKFIQKVWQWKEESGGKILEQMRVLGFSPDFSRTRFTMDAGLANAVRHTFVDWYNRGLIYRGARMINWCTHDGALSDIEVEYKENAGKLYYLRYEIVDFAETKSQDSKKVTESKSVDSNIESKLQGNSPKNFACNPNSCPPTLVENTSETFGRISHEQNADSKKYIIVATTRPETFFGDTAVMVNPKDSRFHNFIGKKVRLPIINKEIPIIADSHVDMEFGSGAVKVTPAHDINDYEVGLRHNLEQVVIFDKKGVLNANCGEFAGLERLSARELIVAKLQELGAIEKIEPHANKIGTCYRCGNVIEPYISQQWFVKADIARGAIARVARGEARFFPPQWINNYNAWMRDLRDWCISRQLWWGHRIPVFYCACGAEFASESLKPSCPNCGSVYEDSNDLDSKKSQNLRFKSQDFSLQSYTEKVDSRFYKSNEIDNLESKKVTESRNLQNLDSKKNIESKNKDSMKQASLDSKENARFIESKGVDSKENIESKSKDSINSRNSDSKKVIESKSVDSKSPLSFVANLQNPTAPTLESYATKESGNLESHNNKKDSKQNLESRFYKSKEFNNLDSKNKTSLDSKKSQNLDSKANAKTPTSKPKKKKNKITQDPDVLDTWFSSALWSHSTLGFANGEFGRGTLWQESDLKEFHPNSLLITGFDILFFWVARMLMAADSNLNQIAFKDIYLHALVLDSKGQKMSKSKGNVIDPLSLCRQYSADIVRFSLAYLCAQGRDVRMSEKQLEVTRNFTNKLANAMKFLQLYASQQDANYAFKERAVLSEYESALGIYMKSRLNCAISEACEALDAYRFDAFASVVYRFLWSEFCDIGVEYAKADKGSVFELASVLIEAMKLLHPLMPFISEFIFHSLLGRDIERGLGEFKSVMVEAFPFDTTRNLGIEGTFSILSDCITSIRRMRVNLELGSNELEQVYIVPLGDISQAETLHNNVNLQELGLKFIGKLAKVKRVFVRDSKPAACISDIGAFAQIFIESKNVDIAGLLSRLEAQEAKLLKEKAKLDSMLNNEKFIQNAPVAVVESNRATLNELRVKLEKISEQRANLRG